MKFKVSFIFCSILISAFAEEYVPKYLKNRYGSLNNNNNDLGSSAPVKTGVKTATKTSSAASKYKGGCQNEPSPPMNSMIRCSKYSGCKAKCILNYQFPNGENEIFIVCNNGRWQTVQMEWDIIPNCEPVCLPNCQNNGICVAPNQCNCPENYQGPQCEYQNKPCLNYPPMPLNTKRSCRSTTCTIQCLSGHRFPDASQIATMICKDGEWVPANPNLASIPDCLATCHPPCQNGGKCLTYNTCQCPQDFRGPQCQYGVEMCSARKLMFNGGYNCTGNINELSCALSCPEGIKFEYQPHPLYTCLYATGVFMPQEIPKCLYEDNMEIVPLGGLSQTYYKTTNSTYITNQRDELSETDEDYAYEAYASRKQKPTNKNVSKHVDNINIHMQDIHKMETLENNLITVEEKKPKEGVCFTWNGKHFKTFDGNIYSVETPCFHTLLRDAIDDTFSISIKNNHCKLDGTLCYRIIRFYIQDKEYILQRNGEGKAVFLTPNKILPIPGQQPGLRVEMQAHFIVVNLDSIGVKIKWDTHQLVQIEVTPALWNRTEGLCGVFDGNSSNDRKAKDGTIHTSLITFTSSWQVDDLDEPCQMQATEIEQCNDMLKAREADDFCNGIIKNAKFNPCYSVVDISEMLQTCINDYCNCKQDGAICACTALDVYVRACMHKGVTNIAKWRDEGTCPMNCDGGRIYMTCAPNEGQATCGSLIEKSEESICEEGCYCPKGTVLHDSKCITKDQCPCRLRGKEYQPGTSVAKKCNTCTCFDGQWLCTEVSCGARCSAIGDPHYITFDGKRYDFMGQCTYTLLQSDNVTIEGENVACSGAISESMNFPISVSSGMPSCTKTVIIKYDGQIIQLKQNHEVAVNGLDVVDLPLTVKDIKIRAISSIFIIVELPNKIEVWWDGLNRAYVDVPAEFKGKTKGLCGTFNSNQNDDFYTPENDIEKSVILFANKWKTNEKCNDVPEKLRSHPCEINIQNKGTSEKMCGKMKSQIFKACHEFVDPEPFYQDCLFDMCSCEMKISNCLCPMLAAYAQECALAGVKIPWRIDVRECGVTCPAGQVYQICGNSCTRTCNDISNSPNCKPQCVEGCNCPEGMALNEYGECMPIGRCKCQHDGIEFPADYKEVRPSYKGMELCTCMNSLWECKLATPIEIKKYPASTELKSKCDSTRNFVFTTCESVEPVTCKNMHDQSFVSANVCHSGCECKDGYVLDSRHRRCVLPSECPCHHGGKSYKEKSIVQSDCNTCKCLNGKWECTNRQCTAECTAWGDSHFRTFDGKLYDYQGQCDYVLAKGNLNNEGNFDVTIQNVPCGSLGVSCSKSVTIKFTSPATDQESIVLTRDQININSIQKIYNSFTVRSTDLYIIIEAADLGVTILWDKGTRVYVKLDPKWKGKVKGLCGNYNNDALDDFQTPSGGIPEVSTKLFGDSWKLQSYCPETEEITDTCKLRPERRVWAVKKCGILKSSTFAPCHSEVPFEEYMERCIFDTCACDQGGDCECLCTAIGAYAQACNTHGITIKWRTQELCPIQCNELCSKYSSCVSTCPPETCDTLLNQTPLSKFCKEETCVEGCEPKKCPPDHVYSNSSLLECVPRSACRPVCLEIGNVTYYEGDLIQSDDCQTCYCSRQKKICKGHTCAPPEVQTVLPQLTQNVVCTEGWTSWINQDEKHLSKDEKKQNDIEPIPSDILMNNLKDGAKCKIGEMINIECRTVDTHMSAKQTGLDVECSMEKGLICTSMPGQRPCPDFEIRLFCKCSSMYLEDTDEDTVTESTKELTTTLPCDVSKPHKAHPISCHIFYHCIPYLDGGKLVEKTCGDYMLFNPETLICDWPLSVYAVRPECQIEIDIDSGSVSLPELEEMLPTSACPYGEVEDECLYECDRLCMHYLYVLKGKGMCEKNATCATGCVSETEKIQCPQGMVWANERTCVSIQDCMCHSHDGQPVKPGEVFKESYCMFCQCIDNYYTCDKSSCKEDYSNTQTVSMGDFVEKQVTYMVKTTVTPPSKCTPDLYTDLTLNQNLPDGDFTASSSLNENFAPHFARINSKISPHSGGSWSPSPGDKSPFLVIDLEKVTPIYGIVIKGSPLYDEYVTSFKVLYSTRENDTWNYILDRNSEPNVFRGSVDGVTPVQQIFYNPVEARYVKILPLTWYGAISLRIELIGCAENPIDYNRHDDDNNLCDEPMDISDIHQQIEVSSEYGPTNSKKELNLKSQHGWRPMTNSPYEFITINFMDLRNITGIKTLGGPSGWVKEYHIRYSQGEKGHWNKILDELNQEKSFYGNFDRNTSQTTHFERPILTTYLKIIPIKWHKNIQMRLEVIGCYQPYPTLIMPITTEAPSICNTCAGIVASELEIGACRCTSQLWWNGQECVPRSQCPCVIGHIPYQVGALYEAEDCSECVCKLGGVPHCEPKHCDQCAEGLKSIVSNTCNCVCVPCEENTVLCPSSNICINATSWCDGIQDCADDESDCETSTECTTTPLPTTLPAEIETKKSLSPLGIIKCETFTCPKGYKAVLQKDRTYVPTMFSNQNVHNKESSIKIQTKGDKKISSKIIPEAIKSWEDEACPIYVCVSKLSTEVAQGKPCPVMECPNGYIPHIPEEKINEQCPEYECILPPPPDAICNVTGRTFNTFDNTEFNYDICNNILVTDMNDFKWEISIQKVCDKFCEKQITIIHDQNVFVFHADLSLEYNGFNYTISQSKKIGSNTNLFSISRLGNTLLFVSNQFGFWVIWSNQESVKIGVSTQLKHHVAGLCGFYNDIQADDKLLPNGKIAATSVEFGDKWAAPNTLEQCENKACPVHIQNKAWEMCNNIKEQVFKACSKVLDVDAFISRCLESTCHCLEVADMNNTAVESCRCKTLETFVVDCMTADKDVELTDWRMLQDCPVYCDSPLIYHDCYRRRCEPSCETITDTESCAKMDNVCFPGCYCPPGLVRKGDACIKSSSCKDCECNVLPHLQYVTYDESNFTINGNCVYIMSRDVMDKYQDEHAFQVLITNHPCRDNPEKMCVGKITILYQGHKIHVFYDLHRNNLKLTVDGERITDFTEVEDWLGVRQTKSKHFKLSLLKDQVEVSVYFPSLGVSVKAPSHKYRNKLEGLCGNCNKDPYDDMTTREGTITDNVEELGLSWLYDKLPGMNKETCANQPVEVCEDLPIDQDPCIQLVDISRYGQCHPLLDPMMFIEWCKKDTCGNHTERACASLGAYARECLSNGFCIHWHSDLCPAAKCADDQEYRPCGNNCPKTCENVLNPTVDEKCVNVVVDGCFCPEGKVLMNNTCVDESMCIVCDDEGHHPGDIWQKDACTVCECAGANLKCEKKHCATIDIVCEAGYSSIKLPKNENECCERIVCVPAATATPTCDPPQPLNCASGQVMKLDIKSDGCTHFVCQCKPLDECDSLNNTLSEPLEDGMVQEVDESGCCPEIKLVCMPNVCPKAPKCSEFYTPIKENITGLCCPKFTCQAPKKCIVDLQYTAHEDGGERERNMYEKQTLLKEANETWTDGPCRECQCHGSEATGYHSVCSIVECPTAQSYSDFTDYEFTDVKIYGQCCPELKRIACKHKGIPHYLNDIWSEENNPCSRLECIANKDHGVQKVTQIINCDETCDIGYEYVKHDSSECCGQCKPYACVVDGMERKVKDVWTSPDFCTNYECINTNGTVQVQSVKIVCPSEPSEELLDDFVFETIPLAGECCKRYKKVACKDNDRIYKMKESWLSDGNICQTIICDESEYGDLIKHESVKTCNRDCPKGWEYKESETECCGECIQTSCVVGDYLKYADDTWQSDDNCTTFVCEKTFDHYVVNSQQSSCPDVSDCPQENLYVKGCCTYCNLTSQIQNQVLCAPIAMEKKKTVGLINLEKETHGICKNVLPLANFTECVGTCESSTFFNIKSGMHESICSCCQATKYQSLIVELTCEDGHRFKKKVAIPSNCSCEGCSNTKSPIKYRIKT